MSFQPGDIISFKDPLQNWKRVRAVVTANLGTTVEGSKHERIFVRNPGGMSTIWPPMEPRKVGHVDDIPKCETCGREL